MKVKYNDRQKNILHNCFLHYKIRSTNAAKSKSTEKFFIANSDFNVLRLFIN